MSTPVRHIEVLLWVEKGKRNEAMAEFLNITLGTVKDHQMEIYQRLGVENRTAAAYWLRELLYTVSQ